MHIPSSLKIAALGLAFGSVSFAQGPAPAPPTTPDAPPGAAAPSSQQLPVVTQTSRVRAFDAGPGGEMRSVYLSNGSVVGLAPGLGGQLGSAVRKGEKLTVTGTKSEINGQALVEAASVRLNGQTYSANAAPGPGALAEGAAPPPQAPPAPTPRRRNRVAAPPPCGATVDALPPPPDPDGPPPPGFEPGPPPPPPSGAAPPPPPDGMAPLPPPQN